MRERASSHGRSVERRLHGHLADPAVARRGPDSVLEHDDANCAPMGSNMQRQAVPLLYTRRRSSGRVSRARRRDSCARPVEAGRRRRSGFATPSSCVTTSWKAGRMVITSEMAGIDSYRLTKFKRLVQTRINQRCRERGRPREEGPAPADGAATRQGELLRATARAVFMPRAATTSIRDPRGGAAHQGRPLHVHPHRGVRAPGPRHQARRRGDHPRDPERQRGGRQEPR